MALFALTLLVICSVTCSISAQNYNSGCLRRVKKHYAHGISDVILSLRTSNLKNCVKTCQSNRVCNSLSFSDSNKSRGKNCFLSELSSNSIHYRIKPKKSWNVYTLMKNDGQSCGDLGSNINLSQSEESSGCFKPLRYGYSFNSSSSFYAKNQYECLMACKRASNGCETLSFISKPYKDEPNCILSSNTLVELQERQQIFGETYGELLAYIKDCVVSQGIK